MTKQDEHIISKALSAAKQAGADGADVSFIKGGGQDIQVRLGKVESAERAKITKWACAYLLGNAAQPFLRVSWMIKILPCWQNVPWPWPDMLGKPYARLATAEEQTNLFRN